MSRYTYYLSLGSNLGDRSQHLRDALHALGAMEQSCLLQSSDVFETEPVELLEQPAFLNLAATVESEEAPQSFLKNLLQIEKDMGRQRTVRYGPRTIDLDILLCNQMVIQDEPDLVLPHPRMSERAFVLVPLLQLAPEVLHPVLGKTVAELWQAVQGKESVRWYSTPLPSGCEPTEN